MNKARWIANSILVVLLLSFTLSAKALESDPGSLRTTADVSQPFDGTAETPDPQFGRHPRNSQDERAEKEMEKARSQERWLDIKKRSEQLLEVATELKQYVDKSGEGVLSLEVLKKAQEMEKLSKELQKKMKSE